MVVKWHMVYNVSMLITLGTHDQLATHKCALRHFCNMQTLVLNKQTQPSNMKHNHGILVLVHSVYATPNTSYQACSKVKDAITFFFIKVVTSICGSSM